MANSPSDTGFTKCFSGAVRRLLCTGSLPTHPSDQIPELSTDELKNPCKDSVGEAKVEVGASPGIVARLMGLDSLPERSWVPRAAALNSITRSMSLNFMDYFPEVDPAQGGQHRRVRTSVSFREVPTSLHQQNHDCFVLFLENVGEAGEMGPHMRKSEMRFPELKQKKEERSKSKDNSKEKALVKKRESGENSKRACKGKNEPKRVSGKLSSKLGTCYGVEDSGSVLLQKKKDVPATSKVKSPVREASVGSKFTKKKDKGQRGVNKVEPECDSENSSPVSVLDHYGFPVHHPTPSAGHSRKMGSKRKKSSSKLANWDYPAPNLIRISNTEDQEQRAIKKKENKQSKKDYYTEIFSKVCKLTEEEMKESKWEAKEASKTEYFEEICTEFEQQILNLLLHQVVNELKEFPM